MKNRYLLIFIFFSIISCGKSPLLNVKEENAKNSVSGRFALQSELSFSKINLKVLPVWEAQPVIEEFNQCLLIFTNKEGRFVDPEQEISFEPTMPEMGHGTSPVEIKRMAKGIYMVSEIFFSMPGKWYIEIKVGENRSGLQLVL